MSEHDNTGELVDNPHAPVHGVLGFDEIVKHACSIEKDGALTLGGRSPNGPAAEVFGRIHDMVDLTDQPDRTTLGILGDAMLTAHADDVDGTAPAGIAFLGQFIDHDMTLDATT